MTSKSVFCDEPEGTQIEVQSNNMGMARLSVRAADSEQRANWLVTTWFIDGVAGRDTNDGTSPATPLQTGRELTARLGPYARWAQSVTITVGAGGCADALNVVGETTAANVAVDVVGTPTVVLDAGTVTSYTSRSHATASGSRLVCSGVTDWTPYVGMRVRITSGTRTNTVVWVLKANPDGAGLNVARTTPGIRLNNVTTASGLTTSQTPTAGDTVVIESLPSVAALRLDIGGIYSTVDPSPNAWAVHQWSIQSLNCPNVSRQASSDPWTARGVLWGCQLVTQIALITQHLASTTKSITAGSLYRLAVSNALYVSGMQYGCGFYNVRSVSIWPGTGGGLQSCQIQDGYLTANSSDCVISDVQMWDWTAAQWGVILYAGVWSDISGSGAGYGIRVYNDTRCILSGTVNVVGALGAYQIATAPALVLTAAQFQAPTSQLADFALSGTATLAAGTRTVAIPYADWTVQTVTLTRNTPGGSIGDLSAPVASRAANQFVINSASATDTSTVDWVISPIKRNIFVGPA